MTARTGERGDDELAAPIDPAVAVAAAAMFGRRRRRGASQIDDTRTAQRGRSQGR